jgi:hypothetical protein
VAYSSGYTNSPTNFPDIVVKNEKYSRFVDVAKCLLLNGILITHDKFKIVYS